MSPNEAKRREHPRIALAFMLFSDTLTFNTYFRANMLKLRQWTFRAAHAAVRLVTPLKVLPAGVSAGCPVLDAAQGAAAELARNLGGVGSPRSPLGTATTG